MESGLNELPADFARHRVLNANEAAAFCSFSVPHWRRLYRAGRVPRPLQLSARKLGWRISDLIEWLARKAADEGTPRL